MPYLRQLPAIEGETVEIRWSCHDGTLFFQRLTIPPKSSRDAIAAADRNAAGQVTERLHSTDAGQRFDQA